MGYTESEKKLILQAKNEARLKAQKMRAEARRKRLEEKIEFIKTAPEREIAKRKATKEWITKTAKNAAKTAKKNAKSYEKNADQPPIFGGMDMIMGTPNKKERKKKASDMFSGMGF